MASFAVPEWEVPPTKLSVAGPDIIDRHFVPPPGLAPPSGLAPPPGRFNGRIEATKFPAGCQDFADSDNEGTSVGATSIMGTGSSEQDEAESEEVQELEAFSLNVKADCWEHRTLLRTPLRKNASLFVPGAAPALPFMSMAQVEESWQRWYDANQNQQDVVPGSFQGAGTGRHLSNRGAGRRNRRRA